MKENTMNQTEPDRLNQFYLQQQKTLKRQGMSKNPTDSYSRAIRRVYKGSLLKPENSHSLLFECAAGQRGIRDKWVVDCTRVGKGITALKYLSKYLYRGKRNFLI